MVAGDAGGSERRRYRRVFRAAGGEGNPLVRTTVMAGLVPATQDHPCITAIMGPPGKPGGGKSGDDGRIRMTTIAFIGVGNMGGPMARNLLKAHDHVRAFDVSASALAPVLEAGA